MNRLMLSLTRGFSVSSHQIKERPLRFFFCSLATEPTTGWVVRVDRPVDDGGSTSGLGSFWVVNEVCFSPFVWVNLYLLSVYLRWVLFCCFFSCIFHPSSPSIDVLCFFVSQLFCWAFGFLRSGCLGLVICECWGLGFRFNLDRVGLGWSTGSKLGCSLFSLARVGLTLKFVWFHYATELNEFRFH